MKAVLLLIMVSPLCLAQYSMSQKFKNKLGNLLRGDIQAISVQKLKKQQSNYIILDAREEIEYQTSHIPGAKHTGFKRFNLEKTVTSLPHDKTIVVYCSVGYRSEIIARDLMRKGFKVLNLYGGIFEWNNHGYPLVNSNETSTKKIHTYNQNWGKWVEKGEKVN